MLISKIINREILKLIFQLQKFFIIKSQFQFINFIIKHVMNYFINNLNFYRFFLFVKILFNLQFIKIYLKNLSKNLRTFEKNINSFFKSFKIIIIY